MISFIKNYTAENIKNKLLTLYLLNVTDIIFTILLMKTGMYVERNTLMINAVQNLFYSFALKILIPAVLLIYICLRIQKASNAQLKKSNAIICIAIIVYVLINISHLVNTSFLLYFLEYASFS